MNELRTRELNYSPRISASEVSSALYRSSNLVFLAFCGSRPGEDAVEGVAPTLSAVEDIDVSRRVRLRRDMRDEVTGRYTENMKIYKVIINMASPVRNPPTSTYTTLGVR